MNYVNTLTMTYNDKGMLMTQLYVHDCLCKHGDI